MRTVEINGRKIGDDNPCFVIAEIGLNHNGDTITAINLIKAAKDAGCDAVKFQKRTIDVIYSKEKMESYKESPFGTTWREYKEAVEFDEWDYKHINDVCKAIGIMWFASCWDGQAVDFMEQFNPPCYKIASASLTDDGLLLHHKKYNRPIILSTGMSTQSEIDHAVTVLGTDNLVLMHCTSTYPGVPEELNLRYIQVLKNKFNIPVGYSGHEVGLCTTVAAATLGANAIERHITLDRAMWGSDQAASVEPQGIFEIVRDIRVVEKAMGTGIKKVYDSELPVIENLRRK